MKSKSSVSSLIVELSQRDTPLSCIEFDDLLRKHLTGDLSLKDIKSLVLFYAEQVGYWSTEWAFSDASNPNEQAGSELDCWDAYLKGLIDLLADTEPEVADVLHRQANLVSLKLPLERRVQYNETRPLDRWLTAIYGNLAIWLLKVGIRKLASSVYKVSLYPPGTVGRNSGR